LTLCLLSPLIIPAEATQLASPEVPRFELLEPPLPQPAATPRYTEHDDGGQTAADQEHNKSDQPKSFDEGFTGDCVALATLLLTGVLAILAVSTAGLWITTQGEIARHCESLPKGMIPAP
jgi:hypothetical protein